jgi:GNAT superfamily N-acetyltransferase
MTKYLKILTRLVLKDYSFYHIYSQSQMHEQVLPIAGVRFQPIYKKEIDRSEETMIVEQAWYYGPCTHAYACMEGSRIVGLCFFWYGEGYRKRNFWPLADHEAKLVQLFVLPEMRGRGIGRSLIQFAAQHLLGKGFKRLYARIWGSNTPSLRAFQQSGWQQVATVVEIFPRGRDKPLRLEFRRDA